MGWGMNTDAGAPKRLCCTGEQTTERERVQRSSNP